MSIEVRKEDFDDIDIITRLTAAAFQNQVHSSHTEQYIVSALRCAGQLTISLVGIEDGEILGHVAVSPVAISSGARNWYGLGPVSVWPDHQGRGIGSTLVKAALAELRRLNASGCVVLGSPGYYGRFGFQSHARLELPGVPPEYFQAISFEGELPLGLVSYHEAFAATE